MRFPKSIKKGDKIGIIAPSFGAGSSPYKDRLERSVERLEQEGFGVVCGPNAYLSEGLGKSNTPQLCAKEIMDFMTGGKVSAVISAGGGETMCEDVKYIDFEKIAASEPVWFCGFSDNTNLSVPMAVNCDIASVYGPNGAHFWGNPFSQPCRETLEIFMGTRNVVTNHEMWGNEKEESDDPFLPDRMPRPFSMKMYLPGEGAENLCPEGRKSNFEGRLIGGCLDCLQVLAGTPYVEMKKFINKYKDEGIVWFFEACDLNPFAVRRAVWQLRENGWFEGTKGFLVGRALRFDEECVGMNHYNAVTGVLEDFNVPILMDLDIGHTAQMMPLVTGCHAVVTADSNSIKIEQKFS